MPSPRTPTFIGTFQVGETVPLRAYITDGNPDSPDFGEPTDPDTSVEVQITDKEGTEVLVSTPMTLYPASTGIYRYDWDTAGRDPMRHDIRVTITDAGKVSIQDADALLED